MRFCVVIILSNVFKDYNSVKTLSNILIFPMNRIYFFLNMYIFIIRRVNFYRLPFPRTYPLLLNFFHVFSPAAKESTLFIRAITCFPLLGASRTFSFISDISNIPCPRFDHVTLIDASWPGIFASVYCIHPLLVFRFYDVIFIEKSRVYFSFLVFAQAWGAARKV